MANPSSSQIEEEIRSILDGADLSTLSSKKVRRLLEEAFNTELTSRKKEIDKVLMEELAKREQKEKEDDSKDRKTDSKDRKTESKHRKTESKDRKTVSKDRKTESKDRKTLSKQTNDGSNDRENKTKVKREVKEEDEAGSMDAGDAGHSDSDSFESPDDIGAPESKKKQKEVKSELLDDEELARRLQEEDAGGRRTRHCNKQKQVHKKAKKEKKEKSNKKAPKTGYNSDMVLSAELAEIMGMERMSRAEVVKRMWQIVKERQLADPRNKQYHICDDQLLKVFGTKRVRTFSMMKYLKRHIKDPHLLSDS